MDATNDQKRIHKSGQLRKIQFFIHSCVVLIFFYVLISFVYKSNKFDFSLLRYSLTEHGGALQALPKEVLSLYVLAQRAKLDQFDLEGTLLSHPLLNQRTVEFLYPVKLEPGARDLFVLEGEPISRDCKAVAKSGKVVHLECSIE